MPDLFNENDIIICTENADHEEQLTLGKEYKVKACEKEKVKITDDKKAPAIFDQTRFRRKA